MLKAHGLRPKIGGKTHSAIRTQDTTRMILRAASARAGAGVVSVDIIFQRYLPTLSLPESSAPKLQNAEIYFPSGII
jgi:hypothetical protein